MILTLASAFTMFLSISFVLVCALMILIVLVQKSSGGGLSGAFGGAGGGSAQAAFGAKVGDVLTWVTVVLFALFLGLAVLLTWNIRQDVESAGAGGPTPAQQAADTNGAGSSSPGQSDDADAENPTPDTNG
jgi:preprotein translocase subunit SecG